MVQKLSFEAIVFRLDYKAAVRGLVAFARRSVCRLSITLGICCYLEILFQWIQGTNPNYEFPWGHYNETLAVVGVNLIGIAYFTREPPRPIEAADPPPKRQKS